MTLPTDVDPGARPLRSLPEFNLTGYGKLLTTMLERGVDIRPVSAMPEPPTGRTAYLRHDIDLHVPGVERVAAIESELGVSSTYFVLVTQHYNPLYPENRAVLRELVEMGHEIGLHYDLMTYPIEPGAAREHLRWELDILSAVVGTPVRSISMHQPYQGRPDLLRGTSEYVHPHNPNFGRDLTYVSDSCRAWRDESLAGWINGDDPHSRLLLLTHPEIWLGRGYDDRFEFLDSVVMDNTLRQHRQFIDQTVRNVWERHPGPKLHDAREARHTLG